MALRGLDLGAFERMSESGYATVGMRMNASCAWVFKWRPMQV